MRRSVPALCALGASMLVAVAPASAKKKDDLQAVIAMLKRQDFDFALQFTNYR